MALMNRWVVSNFLDSRKGASRRGWIPDFIGEAFEFNGQSTAVKMDNGTGKTSVTDAIVGMLSRDRVLQRKTRERLAPGSCGLFTHLRCEFVVPDASAGPIERAGRPVLGETWVFGCYGNSDSDGLHYYCYPGRSEDWPVHDEEAFVGEDGTGEVVKSCRPDEEFLAAPPPQLRRFTRERDWLAELSGFVSIAQLQQLAEYQKKGGGDKAATFYEVKAQPGEAFDEAFFRQHVAPEILVDLGADEEADAQAEGVRSFEARIVRQTQAVIDAKIDTEAKGRRIEAVEAGLDVLAGVEVTAGSFIAARDEASRRLSEFARDLAATRFLLERAAIPGMPANEGDLVASAGQAVADDLKALGWIPGGGVGATLAPLRAASQRLAQHLLRNGARTSGLRLVHGEGDLHLYDLDEVRKAVEERQVPNLPHDEAEAALATATRLTARALERAHPVRAGLIQAEVDAEGIRRARDRADQAERHKRAEASTLLEGVEAYQENERAFARMAASGLFAPEDLEVPERTRKRLEEDRTATGKTLEAHNRRMGELAGKRTGYDAVVAEFGGADLLSAALDEMEARLDAASEAEGEARDALEGLKERRRATEASRNKVAEAHEAVKGRVADLEEPARAFDRLEAAFGPDPDPGQVERRIRDESEASRAALDAADAALEELRRRRQDLELRRSRDANASASAGKALGPLLELAPDARAFEAAHPGRRPDLLEQEERLRLLGARAAAAAAAKARAEAEALLEAYGRFRAATGSDDPAAWIDAGAGRREELLARRSGLLAREAKALRDIEALRTNPVAPTLTEEAAATALDGLGHEPLYRAIEAAAPGEERRRLLLDHFSAMLFAPVLDGEAAAAEAARRLAAARLPVGVVVRSDVARWARGDALAVSGLSGRPDGARGVFTGVRTPAVEAILDPEAIERHKALLEDELRVIRVELSAVATEIRELDPEGDAMRLARTAKRAVDEDAAGLRAEALGRESAAEAEAAEAEELLRDEVLARAARAARYHGLGGDEQVERLRHERAEAEARVAEADRELDECDGRRRAAEAELPTLRARRDDAVRAEAHLGDCASAQRFVEAGGRAEMEARRREAERLGRELLVAAQALTDLARDMEAAQERLDRTAGEKVDADRRIARWGEGLKAAIAFVRSGERDELDAGSTVERTLKERERRIWACLAFDFEAAQSYVAARGAGIDETKARIERLRREADAHAAERRRADEALPAALSLRDRRARTCRGVEQALADTVAQYGLVRRDRELPPVPETALEVERELASRLRRALDPDGAWAADYQELSDLVKGYGLEARNASYVKAEAVVGTLRAAHEKAVSAAAGSAALDPALKRQVVDCRDVPEKASTLVAAVRSGLARERQLFEAARDRERENREQLVLVLKALANNASSNLDRLKRVLRRGAARIELNVAVAGDDAIERVLEDMVTLVERQHRRQREDADGGRGQDEREFREGLSRSVRQQIYRRMFVKDEGRAALVEVTHPSIREGQPFRFVREGLSGGQATALTLLWTIKLAEFSIEREAARYQAASRRRAREALHSIVIVDGLFSDLSEPDLIRESMEAMADVSGSFQLIGLIHNVYYRNDWEVFPCHVIGNRIVSYDEAGRASRAVAIRSMGRDTGVGVSSFHAWREAAS